CVCDGSRQHATFTFAQLGCAEDAPATFNLISARASAAWDCLIIHRHGGVCVCVCVCVFVVEMCALAQGSLSEVEQLQRKQALFEQTLGAEVEQVEAVQRRAQQLQQQKHY